MAGVCWPGRPIITARFVLNYLVPITLITTPPSNHITGKAMTHPPAPENGSLPPGISTTHSRAE